MTIEASEERPVKLSPRTPDEDRIHHALKSMAAYFELPEKSVKFFIRQYELSQK